MFAEIFGMGIQTILLCFIADEEMFSVEDRFADDSLRETVRKTTEDHKMSKVKGNQTAVLNAPENNRAAESTGNSNSSNNTVAANNRSNNSPVKAPPQSNSPANNNTETRQLNGNAIGL